MRRKIAGISLFVPLAAVLAVSETPPAAPVHTDEPVAVSPGSAQMITTTADLCPTFSWTAVETAEAYRLMLYRIGNEASKVLPVLTETFPAGAFSWTPPLERCLERDKSYGWAVRALHAEGPGPWSEVRIFRVGSRPSAEEVRAAVSMLEEYLEGEGGSDVDARRAVAGPDEQPVAGRPLLSREAEGRREQEGAPTEASVHQGDLFPPPSKPTEVVISGGDEAGARVVIEADTDNNEEADHPSVRLAQDGGLVYGFVGFSDAENDLKIKAGASGHDNDIAFYTGGFLTPGPEERLRITSEGEIRWAPQTSTAFVDQSDFLEAGCDLVIGGACWETAPLLLPHGATVASMTAWWSSSHTSGATLSLIRGDFYENRETMMRLASDPFPVVCPGGEKCLSAQTTVIDNGANHYYLRVTKQDLEPFIDPAVLGVRIEYTVTRPH